MKTKLLHFNAVQLQPAGIDEQAGVLRGVAVITGGIEALGHDLHVGDSTLEEILAEGNRRGKVPVKLDHDGKIGDVVGYLASFRREDDKVKADLRLLESHPMRPVVIEMARTMPECYGLSVSFVGGGELDAEGSKVAKCRELLSCDLVAQPAANPSGLFSARYRTEDDDPQQTKTSMKKDPKKITFTLEEDAVLNKLPAHVRSNIEEKRKKEARKKLFRKLIDTGAAAATGAALGATLSKSPLRAARVGGLIGGGVGAAQNYSRRADNVIEFSAKKVVVDATKNAPSAKMLAGAPADDAGFQRIKRSWGTYAQNADSIESHSFGSLLRRLMLDADAVETLLQDGSLKPTGQDANSGNLLFRAADLDRLRGEVVGKIVGEAERKFGRTTVAVSCAERALRDQMVVAASAPRRIEFMAKRNEYEAGVVRFGIAGLLMKGILRGGKNTAAGKIKRAGITAGRNVAAAGRWAAANPGKSAGVAGIGVAGASAPDDEDTADRIGSVAKGALVSGGGLGLAGVLRKLRGAKGLRPLA